MLEAHTDYLQNLENFMKTCGKDGVVANMMRKMGFEPGKGLGAKHQGILQPISAELDFRIAERDYRGFGYQDPWLKAMLEAQNKNKPKVTTAGEILEAIREEVTEKEEKKEKEKPKVTSADWTPVKEWSKPVVLRPRNSSIQIPTASTSNTNYVKNGFHKRTRRKKRDKEKQKTDIENKPIAQELSSMVDSQTRNSLITDLTASTSTMSNTNLKKPAKFGERFSEWDDVYLILSAIDEL